MSTVITNPDDKKEYKVTKALVTSLCQVGCKHKHIRRLATAMAIEICTCAEQHGLEGDLSKRLDKLLLSKGEPRLSPKEKAWANSFCQDLENLEIHSSFRLPQLLAEDYNNRFQKNNKKQSSTGKNKNNNKVTIKKEKAVSLEKDKKKQK